MGEWRHRRRADLVADFNPLSHEYLVDPLAAVQRIFETSPVFFYEPLNAYFVLRYDDVRRILDDSETYSSHAYKGMPVRDDLRERIPEQWERVGQVIQGGQSINMDPPAHTTQRRALQRTFTNKTVEGAKPEIAAIANELIDGFADRGSCDLMQEFATQLTVRVVATMLELPQELLPGFLAWIGDVFAVLAPIDLSRRT